MTASTEEPGEGQIPKQAVIWRDEPQPGPRHFFFLLCGLLALFGLLVLFIPVLPNTPEQLYFIAEEGILPRTIAGLAMMGMAIALIIIDQRSYPISYELSAYDLRIYRRNRLSRRLVRGELRLLRRRAVRTVSWAPTMGFSGNASGIKQWGPNGLSALGDPAGTLERLAQWTTGDEVLAEAAAERFLDDENMHGMQLQEPRRQLGLNVPADWPAEARQVQRRPLTLLNWQSPLMLLHRGTLLPLQDTETPWDSLRVRACDRTGFYLEISDRTGEEYRQQAVDRWRMLGPLEAVTEQLPMDGFHGIMAEQTPPPSFAKPPTVENPKEWCPDGTVDEGFGFVPSGGRRLLMWATDGEIALQVRAYLPPENAASERAIRRVIASIKRTLKR